uniref:(northern house mosquito) hypothetical protein n=1 Tax=Culex pipiens TaxID=7175 RepID=A0A8D8FQM2_CULPI
MRNSLVLVQVVHVLSQLVQLYPVDEPIHVSPFRDHVLKDLRRRKGLVVLVQQPSPAKLLFPNSVDGSVEEHVPHRDWMFQNQRLLDDHVLFKRITDLLQTHQIYSVE